MSADKQNFQFYAFKSHINVLSLKLHNGFLYLCVSVDDAKKIYFFNISVAHIQNVDFGEREFKHGFLY